MIICPCASPWSRHVTLSSCESDLILPNPLVALSLSAADLRHRRVLPGDHVGVGGSCWRRLSKLLPQLAHRGLPYTWGSRLQVGAATCLLFCFSPEKNKSVDTLFCCFCTKTARSSHCRSCPRRTRRVLERDWAKRMETSIIPQKNFPMALMLLPVSRQITIFFCPDT